MSGETETEFLELQILPHGLIAARAPAEIPRWVDAVVARFAECDAAGLVALAAAAGVSGHVSPSVTFWREIGSEFLRSLCLVPEGEAPTKETIEPPTAAQLAEWTLNAPPMQGGEYLGPEQLTGAWKRLLEWTLDQVGECGGVGDFLTAYAPKWSRVGRVTVHLAENKGDDEYPFAFMATYAAGLTRDGRIRRVPLGGALKEYAGARKKAELLKLLSPLHAAAERSALVADLVETGDVFHPLVWTPFEAHSFLKEIPTYEECGLFAQLPNWWRKRARPRVSVTLDSKSGGSLGIDAMLDFHLSIALGGQPLSRKETKALMENTDGLMLLRGEWVEVDRAQLQEALEHWEKVQDDVGSDGVSFVEGMRLLAGASADLKQEDGVEEHASWSLVNAGERLQEILVGMRTPAGLSGEAPAGLRGTLRDYQKVGLNWLWLCSKLGVGSCLADDMGLGKTIQVLAVLLRTKQDASKSKAKAKSKPASLLVLPASLIGNWKAEAARFAPSLKLLVAHGSESSRQQLADVAADPVKQLEGIDLVITTYTMASRLDWLQAMRWTWVILDEAQAIKNPGTRQTKAIKKLSGSSRLAMTGTPVENRLGDLWSLFDFINPGLLGTPAKFKAFAKSLEQSPGASYAPLRNLVAPYILRRMKTDPSIVPDLPDKTEVQAFCGLAKPQAVLYEQAIVALTKALAKPKENGDSSGGIKRRGLVLSSLMRFKQICNHPSQLTGDGAYDPDKSGKFARLAEICGEISSRGEKALIFTQFREITQALADHLASVFGRDGLVLHGGTAVAARKKLVADFQRDDGPPFFVLSIKAGGTGLNLTAASHVIHFDRWWNPAVENQATDRAFRIGQKRNVLVHKFVTKGTIEEKIDALIQEKQSMADEILDGGAEKALTEMSDDEILNLVSLDIERASM